MYNRKQAIELLEKHFQEFKEDYLDVNGVEWQGTGVDRWMVDAVIEASKGSIHIIPKYHEPLIKNSFE